MTAHQSRKRLPERRRSDFRALTMFTKLAAGQKTLLVEEDGSDPHLRRGEYAVIDTTDRDLQHGELYVIQWESGARRRKVIQARSAMLNITGPGAPDSLIWWVGDLRGYRKTDQEIFGCSVFAGMSDGPYESEHLQSKLIGRVVGVANAPLGGLIAETAGEEESNATFDPGKYLDVLIAAGYRPSVFRGKYYEEMPDRQLSDEEELRVLAISSHRRAASTATERLKQECIRRGLAS